MWSWNTSLHSLSTVRGGFGFGSGWTRYLPMLIYKSQVFAWHSNWPLKKGILQHGYDPYRNLLTQNKACIFSNQLILHKCQVSSCVLPNKCSRIQILPNNPLTQHLVNDHLLCWYLKPNEQTRKLIVQNPRLCFQYQYCLWGKNLIGYLDVSLNER